MIHGGRFLQSEFVFHGPRGDTTGLGIIGYETESGRFTSFWTDSRSTRISICSLPTAPDGSRNIASPMPRSRPFFFAALRRALKPS